jgi:hypothetical protein
MCFFSCCRRVRRFRVGKRIFQRTRVRRLHALAHLCAQSVVDKQTQREAAHRRAVQAQIEYEENMRAQAHIAELKERQLMFVEDMVMYKINRFIWKQHENKSRPNRTASQQQPQQHPPQVRKGPFDSEKIVHHPSKSRTVHSQSTTHDKYNFEADEESTAASKTSGKGKTNKNDEASPNDDDSDYNFDLMLSRKLSNTRRQCADNIAGIHDFVNKYASTNIQSSKLTKPGLPSASTAAHVSATKHQHQREFGETQSQKRPDSMQATESSRGEMSQPERVSGVQPSALAFMNGRSNSGNGPEAAANSSVRQKYESMGPILLHDNSGTDDRRVAPRPNGGSSPIRSGRDVPVHGVQPRPKSASASMKRLSSYSYFSDPVNPNAGNGHSAQVQDGLENVPAVQYWHPPGQSHSHRTRTGNIGDPDDDAYGDISANNESEISIDIDFDDDGADERYVSNHARLARNQGVASRPRSANPAGKTQLIVQHQQPPPQKLYRNNDYDKAFAAEVPKLPQAASTSLRYQQPQYQPQQLPQYPRYDDMYAADLASMDSSRRSHVPMPGPVPTVPAPPISTRYSTNKRTQSSKHKQRPVSAGHDRRKRSSGSSGGANSNANAPQNIPSVIPGYGSSRADVRRDSNGINGIRYADSNTTAQAATTKSSSGRRLPRYDEFILGLIAAEQQY